MYCTLHRPLKTCKTTRNEKYFKGICDVTCQNQVFVNKMSCGVMILLRKNEVCSFHNVILFNMFYAESIQGYDGPKKLVLRLCKNYLTEKPEDKS